MVGARCSATSARPVPMPASTPDDPADLRRVAAYFGLVGLLTLPFWIAAALIKTRLMPGLSVAALAVVAPMLAAVIVEARAGGAGAVRALFGSLGRPGRRMVLVGLYAVAIPLAVGLAAWSWSGATGRLEFAAAPSLVALFLVAALAEEIGWSAFAARRLAHAGLGVTSIGLVVGLAWALWHFPALIDLGRPVGWIAWWSLGTVAQRIVMVWLYQRSRSWVWAPILFHASANIAWQVAGEAFDPRSHGLAMAAVAALVVLARSKSANG